MSICAYPSKAYRKSLKTSRHDILGCGVAVVVNVLRQLEMTAMGRRRAVAAARR
jgi:hypothetical protein